MLVVVAVASAILRHSKTTSLTDQRQEAGDARHRHDSRQVPEDEPERVEGRHAEAVAPYARLYVGVEVDVPARVLASTEKGLEDVVEVGTTKRMEMGGVEIVCVGIALNAALDAPHEALEDGGQHLLELGLVLEGRLLEVADVRAQEPDERDDARAEGDRAEVVAEDEAER